MFTRTDDVFSNSFEPSETLPSTQVIIYPRHQSRHECHIFVIQSAHLLFSCSTRERESTKCKEENERKKERQENKKDKEEYERKVNELI